MRPWVSRKHPVPLLFPKYRQAPCPGACNPDFLPGLRAGAGHSWVGSELAHSAHSVDPGCMSPDVKNAIHVGDRVLEINGTPIRNVPLDEVQDRLHPIAPLSYPILWLTCPFTCPPRSTC